MKLEEIIEKGLARKIEKNSFPNFEDRRNSDAIRFIEIILYLNGKMKFVNFEHLSSEYKFLEEEAYKLGSQKLLAKKMDTLVQIFNKYCFFKEKRHNNFEVYGVFPKKIATAITRKYAEFISQDAKIINKMRNDYDSANEVSNQKPESEEVNAFYNELMS